MMTPAVSMGKWRLAGYKWWKEARRDKDGETRVLAVDIMEEVDKF